MMWFVLRIVAGFAQIWGVDNKSRVSESAGREGGLSNSYQLSAVSEAASRHVKANHRDHRGTERTQRGRKAEA